MKNLLTPEIERLNIFPMKRHADFSNPSQKLHQENTVLSIFFSSASRRIIYTASIVLPSKNLPFSISALILLCNPSGAESEALMDSEAAKLIDSAKFDHVLYLLRKINILFDFCQNQTLRAEYEEALEILEALTAEARQTNRIREYVENLTKAPIQHGKGHTLWKVVEQTRHEKTGLASKAERTLSGDKWPNCRATISNVQKAKEN